MLDRGEEGHIVNTASVSGLFGAPTSGAYAMSKFAVVAATEALAGDLALIGAAVRASVLCPGIVRTDIATRAQARLEDSNTAASDGQRFVTDLLLEMVPHGIDPGEVASLVVDAIRDEGFLILTHPHHAETLSARTTDLVAGRVPTIPDFT